ncbi:MAG: type II toxin-antitoxin system RelE/ParE family toxin [Bacteroidota bacterium]
MYSIIWSPTAQNTYLEIIDYLIDNWSLDTALKFDYQVNRLLKSLESFKHFCPASEKQPSYRRCVINKQPSLVYQVQNSTINLVTFLDNRSVSSF